MAPRLTTAYDACLIQRRGIGLLSAPDLESHSVGGALRSLLEEVLVYVEDDRAARGGLVVLTTTVVKVPLSPAVIFALFCNRC